MPGAIIIGRNVLEWRLDPRSEARIPALARADMQIIVMCSQGYASTLAAASLRRIGLHEATDLDGGFQAWQASRAFRPLRQPLERLLPPRRFRAAPSLVARTSLLVQDAAAHRRLARKARATWGSHRRLATERPAGLSSRPAIEVTKADITGLPGRARLSLPVQPAP